MLKPLIKKQLLELKGFFLRDRKSNIVSSGSFGLIFAYIAAFVGFEVLFFMLSSAIGGVMIPMGFSWLYFALMGITAIALGAFGSAFNTYAWLYKAKDNETLMAMPIKAGDILTSRMVGVYLTGFMYSTLVWLPTCAYYFVSKRPLSVLEIVNPVLLLFVIPLLVTVISCLLGWIIALIASKFKKKNAITVIVSLAVMFAYFSLSTKAEDFIKNIGSMVGQIDQALNGWGYPIRELGQGAAGNAGAMAIFCLIVVALFALCYLILSVTFRYILQRQEAPIRKSKLRAGQQKIRSLKKTLLKRELSRLTSSSIYMINSCLGFVFMIGLAVLTLFKWDVLGAIVMVLRAMLEETSPARAEALLPIAAAVIVCFFSSTIVISAPSVSLEGKTLWIIRSLPVNTWDVLYAKEMLHVLLSLIPLLIASVVFGIALGANALQIVLIIVMALAYTWMMADLGIFLNLKKPNLTWTSEAIPIKQSMSVGVCLLGGMVFCALLGVTAYFMSEMVCAEIFLLLWTVIFGGIAALLHFKYFKNKGAQTFERL